MAQNQSLNRGLVRLAGISALLAGACILVFAIVAESKGIFFIDGVYQGASIDPWLQNVLAHPGLSRIIMVLPIIGFSSMFVLMRALQKVIAQDSWQKTLALSGYSIGVPVVVLGFVMQLSLMNLMLVHGTRLDVMPTMKIVATLQLLAFHVINDFIGPLFVIVLGTAMLAWAALKANALPRWICLWLMTCCVMVSLSFLAPLIPAIAILGLFAPLHMVGLVLLGVNLLRRRWS